MSLTTTIGYKCKCTLNEYNIDNEPMTSVKDAAPFTINHRNVTVQWHQTLCQCRQNCELSLHCHVQLILCQCVRTNYSAKFDRTGLCTKIDTSDTRGEQNEAKQIQRKFKLYCKCFVFLLKINIKHSNIYIYGRKVFILMLKWKTYVQLHYSLN